jgi:hypothetical protein
MTNAATAWHGVRARGGLRRVRALSVSPAVLELMWGSLRPGIPLGHGYVDLDGYVLAVTPTSAPRMPNGLCCELPLVLGEPVLVGGGLIRHCDAVVTPGPLWGPRPVVGIDAEPPVALPDPMAFAGRGGGLTPAGDDLLIGYVAGLALFHDRQAEAEAIVERVAPRTTSLSRTLLGHAAAGDLPEPAHAFVGRGDPLPLLTFGHTSGRFILVGLNLARGRAGGFGSVIA